MKRTLAFAFTLLAICPGLIACGAPAEEAATGEEQLEIYNWWTHPGEADALSALIGSYEAKYENTQVINAAVESNVKAQEELHARMQSGSPPDTFQVVGGWNLMQWVAYNGHDDSESKLEPVDFSIDANRMRSAVPAAVLDTVSYNGHAYSVPLAIHRYNTLFFNKKLFAENALNPPTTLAEFYEVSAALEAKGITPLSIAGKDGFFVSILAWDAVLIAKAGAQFRQDFFSGNADPNDPRIADTLTELARILEHTNVDSSNWAEAAQMVIDGDAAMTICGDWAKGFFLSHGWDADTDLGALPPPGNDGVFIFIVDSFNLPRGVPDRQAAKNFLNLIGSTEAQELFNPIKGSIPPRTDVDRSKFDSLAQEAMNDFESDTLTPARDALVKNPDFTVAVDAAMEQFAIDHDVDTVINVLKNRYDQL